MTVRTGMYQARHAARVRDIDFGAVGGKKAGDIDVTAAQCQENTCFAAAVGGFDAGVVVDE